MKFDSNSVLLNKGIEVKVDVYIPTFLMDYDIPDEVWRKAIAEFNQKLNQRKTVTQKINEIEVDVLKIESVDEDEYHIGNLRMGAVILLLVAHQNDIYKISDIHFCLTGQLTFEGNTNIVDGMTIKNITYGGSNSKQFKLLEEESKKD